ncbi:MAG: tRNA adenosine(34) deaminase TadA [Deltaproteobacteria bacterium]|nr:tRNA adenosine(34) deaminase TadA [Deltaproteobacteria bacterium]
MNQDENFMMIALEEAKAAIRKGEVPVGAVIVLDQDILARAHNSPIALHDPSAHAEILVLREAAGKIGNYRLTGTTLYVTVEPCIMCVGAIVHARISRLVYGASDPKNGGVASLYRMLEDPRLNHTVEVKTGVLVGVCAELLSRFFQEKRIKK